MDRATAWTSSARVTSTGRTSHVVWSTGKTSTLPEVLSPMRFAASASTSRRWPEIATVQPSAARASAPARPMPLPPPVTQATRFPFDVIYTSMVSYLAGVRYRRRLPSPLPPARAAEAAACLGIRICHSDFLAQLRLARVPQHPDAPSSAPSRRDTPRRINSLSRVALRERQILCLWPTSSNELVPTCRHRQTSRLVRWTGTACDIPGQGYDRR